MGTPPHLLKTRKVTLVPESRKRKKKNKQEVHSDTELQKSWVDDIPLSPSWWAPVFITLMVLGLFVMLTYYMSGAQYPIPGVGNWNMALGLGLMMAGFLMTLRWR